MPGGGGANGRAVLKSAQPCSSATTRNQVPSPLCQKSKTFAPPEGDDRREVLKMVDHFAAGDGDADRPPGAQHLRLVRHQRRFSSPGGPSGSSVRLLEEEHRNLVEMVYPGGIASGDLGLLLFGAVLQNLLDDLVAPREGGLDMGIV
jgi:hypothetical protein